MKNNSFVISKKYQNKSFKLYTFQIILILLILYVIKHIKMYKIGQNLMKHIKYLLCGINAVFF